MEQQLENQRRNRNTLFSFTVCENSNMYYSHTTRDLSYRLNMDTLLMQVFWVHLSPSSILYCDPHMEACLQWFLLLMYDSLWSTLVEAANLGVRTFLSCQSLGLTTVFQSPWVLDSHLEASPMSSCPVLVWLLRKDCLCSKCGQPLIEAPRWPDKLTLPVSSLMLWERKGHCFRQPQQCVQLNLNRKARFFPWLSGETPGKCLWSKLHFCGS